MSAVLRLAGVEVPGDAAPWEALGFVAVEGAIALRNGAVLTGASQVGLAVDGRDALGPLEGVAVATGLVRPPIEHPNGALELDHVVLMTGSLDRTSAAIESQWGLERRRVRETPTVRQAFHRFADAADARGCIVEVVERPDLDRTTLWGLVVSVADLDAFVASSGDLVGEPRTAVQPGRRIATVRRDAGLPVAVAVMSP